MGHYRRRIKYVASLARCKVDRRESGVLIHRPYPHDCLVVMFTFVYRYVHVSPLAMSLISLNSVPLVCTLSLSRALLLPLLLLHILSPPPLPGRALSQLTLLLLLLLSTHALPWLVLLLVLVVNSCILSIPLCAAFHYRQLVPLRVHLLLLILVLSQHCVTLSFVVSRPSFWFLLPLPSPRDSWILPFVISCCSRCWLCSSAILHLLCPYGLCS